MFGLTNVADWFTRRRERLNSPCDDWTDQLDPMEYAGRVKGRIEKLQRVLERMEQGAQK